MSSQPLALQGVPGTILSRFLAFASAALHAVTGRHVLYTSLLCLAWSCLEIGKHVPNYLHTSWWPALNAVLSMQFNGIAVMLSVVVADRASSSSLPRWWPYAMAVIVGVAMGTTLMWLVSQQLVGIPTAYHPRAAEPLHTFAFRHALHGFVVCGLGTVAYVSRRRATQRLATLRTVQLERAQVEKRVLRSRLAAMQARVEPRFLLDALARVERLYEVDAQPGDNMLKELVTYLRAAIPQIRDPSSTVAREIGLVDAYFTVIGGELKERVPLRITGTLPEDARLPPMVLLPLMNHALAHRAGCAGGDDCFQISAVVCHDRLRLTVCDPGGGFAAKGDADAAISHIHERLATLYGDRASLTLRTRAEGSEAVIDLPYEGSWSESQSRP
jgi:hypothetical protein